MPGRLLELSRLRDEWEEVVDVRNGAQAEVDALVKKHGDQKTLTTQLESVQEEIPEQEKQLRSANQLRKLLAEAHAYADLLPASDGTAPFAIHTFNQIAGGQSIDPRRAAIANDRFVFTGQDADAKQTSIRTIGSIRGGESLQKTRYRTQPPRPQSRAPQPCSASQRVGG